MNFQTKDVQTPSRETDLAGQRAACRSAMLIGTWVVNGSFILFSLGLFPHPDTDSSGRVNFKGMRHFPVDFKCIDSAC